MKIKLEARRSTTHILVDLDEVMADFTGGRNSDPLRRNPPEMYAPGFFLGLQPVDGALEGVQELYQLSGVTLHVLSKPVAYSARSYTEKIMWLGKWFPYLVDKVTLTQDKSHVKGDILIDDTPWDDFEGKQIKFEVGGGKQEWIRVVNKVRELL